MKAYKELDSQSPWMYAQEKQQEKKQSKQMRNARQSKRDNWNAMESV